MISLAKDPPVRAPPRQHGPASAPCSLTLVTDGLALAARLLPAAAATGPVPLHGPMVADATLLDPASAQEQLCVASGPFLSHPVL